MHDDVICRDVSSADDPVLPGARILYENVLDEEERIPWEWLARTPDRRREWQPGRRRPHLVVAIRASDPDQPLGFGYGAFLPGYGGYVCYLGVDPKSRGQGIGSKLFRFVFELIDDAARASSMAVPFVIWESHRVTDSALWNARLRLFSKVEGLWARGITLHTPNYMHDDAPPVQLQVFLRAWDERADAFDADRIRAAVAGIYREVYHISPDDPLYRATMEPAVNPHLVPAVDAMRED